MAKLIYSAITIAIDGYVADEDGNFDWARRTTRCTPSSTTSSARSAPTSTDAGCTTRWPSGRTRTRSPTRTTVTQDFGRVDLAGGRQDRVLDDARGGHQREDAAVEHDFDPEAIRQIEGVRGT